MASRRTAAMLAFGLALSPALLGQDLDARVVRLLDPTRRVAALFELQRAGDDGARAVLAALAATAPNAVDAATTLASTLAELGTATAGHLPALVAEVGRHDEPVRSLLLRALANGALRGDGAGLDVVRAALPGWAQRGWLYSPAEDQPTFAWYEYVRLVQRMRLAADPATGAHLGQAMAELNAVRSVAWGNRPQPVHAIEGHGAHGQRELLEAIAELALDCPDDVAGVIDELRQYLEASPPREPELRTEHCAGIGESAPADLPGMKWPTRWRYDAWRCACATTVLARHRAPAARELALRHLLHADALPTRLTALAMLRQRPQPWQPFAADLLACLGHADRMVAREALLAMAIDPTAASADGTIDALRGIAAGADPELALLAGKALRALR